MSQSIVPKHKRRVKGKWKLVHAYKRSSKGVGKKRIVGKKAIKLYPVRDEYGHVLGWKG